MIWLSLIVLGLGAGGGAWLAVKISRKHYQRKMQQRLDQVKAEYVRQIAKMQALQQQKAQQTKTIEQAESVAGVSDAIDAIHSGF